MKYLGFLLAVVVPCSAWASDDLPALPEAVTRPAPIQIGAYASPMTAGPVRTPAGVSEGDAFIASLRREEREVLLSEKVFLLPKEDPDSPSMQGDDDSGVKGYIRALAIFNQPKQRTLELMFEPNALSRFLPSLDGSDTVRRVDNYEEMTKFTIEFLWWDIDFWIQHWFYPEYSRYEWYLDTEHYENDIDDNKGYWQVYALNEHQSVGEYGVQVDTGIPVPRRMFERIQRREIPKAMWAFKKYIDSGGTYQKD